MSASTAAAAPDESGRGVRIGLRFRPTALQAAAAVSLLALACGSVILHLSRRAHDWKASAELSKTADEAANEIERKLQETFGLVFKHTSTGERSRLGNKSWIPVGVDGLATDRKALPLTDYVFEAVKSQLGRAEGATGPVVTAPFRALDGTWLALVRVPVISSENKVGATTLQWFGVLVPLDLFLDSAKMRNLPAQGYDYEVRVIDPAHRRTRPVARTTEQALNEPVRRPIRFTDEQWELLAARRRSAATGAGPFTGALLIGIFTLVAGLTAYDGAGGLERLRTRLAKNTQRLKSTKHLLVDARRQRTELEKQFAHAGFHDMLTGLPNRRYFMSRLERGLARLRRDNDSWIAVLIVNLDHFKTINDALGYAVGDDVIVQSVKRIEDCFRPSDLIVARMTGDEFAVLLFGVLDPEAATAAAARVQDALAKPFETGGQTVFVTAGVGVALGSSGYEQPDELVREAEFALSQAKAMGRSKYAVFDRASRDQLIASQQIETGLHEALERGQFELRYQPIVSLTSGRVAGMETLIRWQHPSEGMIPPDKFIRVAEETGLIVQITRWVLRQACAQARHWKSRLPEAPDFYLSVNLSGKDLIEPDLCEYLGETIRQADLPAGTIRLEVTESVMIGNVNATLELVSRFRRMGIPLLLDDFGTGYSSLSYLNRFRFDYLKIDRSFVTGLASSSHQTGILSAIIHLAKDLEIRTIAEGVETTEVMEGLRKLGCDFAQGYFFAKPLTAREADALLASNPVW